MNLRGISALAQTLRLDQNLISSSKRLEAGLPIAFSLDVADRCPNDCACYWRALNRVEEMSDDGAIAFVSDLVSQGLIHGTLIGGEPYVRPTLLPQLTKIIPVTWIVTSGTTPLLVGLPHTTHFISVDGADAQTHDRVRGRAGLFDRVLGNIRQARMAGPFPAFVHTVLNQINYQQIEAILRFWREGGLVDGVIFSTITPIRGGPSEDILLSDAQRDSVVEDLLHLKSQFGDFLFMSRAMINYLCPSQTRKLTPRSCGTAKWVVSFDASGKRRLPCVLSDKADCSRCGCAITTIFNNIVKMPPDLTTFRTVIKAVRL